MATVQKFYLHAAATADSGTLPGASTLSATTPNVTATGASTNRSMDGTKGTAQASIALSTRNVTTAQANWFGRWCSPPLAAASIPSGTANWTVATAASESNTKSQLRVNGRCLVAWRPSTGAVVGTISDNTGVGSGAGPVTASEAAYSLSFNGAAVAIQNGDILVLELWGNNVQSQASAFTNTYFYDGTTEASASSNAAFLSSPVALTLYTVATTYSVSGPSSGMHGQAETFFVTPDGFFTGTITPSDGGGGGTFSPTSLTWSDDNSSKSFTYTPASAGDRTISFTNSGTLANPSSVAYESLNACTAPAFVAAYAPAASTTSTSITLNVPSGAVAGNLLVALLYSTGSTGLVGWNQPTGWTPISQADTTLNASDAVTGYYRVMQAGDASVTFTVTPNTSGLAGAMLAYSGYNASLDVDAAGAAGQSSATFTGPTLNPTYFDAIVLSLFGAPGSPTFTTPPGATLRASVPGTNVGISVFDQTATSTSPTPPSSTCSGSSGVVASVVVPPVATATAYSLTGPTTGTAGVATSAYTVSPNNPLTGTITPSAGGGGGTFSPASLAWSGTMAGKTFTYTPPSTPANANYTISTTNNDSLPDPSSITLVVGGGGATVVYAAALLLGM